MTWALALTSSPLIIARFILHSALDGFDASHPVVAGSATLGNGFDALKEGAKRQGATRAVLCASCAGTGPQPLLFMVLSRGV